MFPKREVKSREKKTKRNFAEENGYILEAHEITTEDGYILTLLRVSKKPESIIEVQNKEVKSSVKKPVTLLVHGLFCKGTDWCFTTSDKGLPYKLIEEGYDCWLANLRGSPLSKGHVNLSTESKSYWDFTFHEMGIYDLTKTVSYILETTGNTSLSFIGHSMGCAVFLVMLTTCPEYASKINVFIALAPAVYGSSIRKLLFKSLIPFGSFLGTSKFIRNREICGHSADKNFKYVTPLSKRANVGAWFLRFVGGEMGAFGKKGVEKERLKSFSAEWPSPSSIKVFCHGVQCYQHDRAQQYDYGRRQNLIKYGQENPPDYNFSKITVPVATFCSEGDELCRPTDVSRLAKDLKNNIGHYYLNDKDFAHIDFLIGKDAHTFVYKRVIQILSEYKFKA